MSRTMPDQENVSKQQHNKIISIKDIDVISMILDGDI